MSKILCILKISTRNKLMLNEVPNSLTETNTVMFCYFKILNIKSESFLQCLECLHICVKCLIKVCTYASLLTI